MQGEIQQNAPVQSEARTVWSRVLAGRPFAWIAALLLVAITLAIILLYPRLQAAPPLMTDEHVAQIVDARMASATPPPAFSATVYQAIFPSLVRIRTEVDDAPEGEDRGLGTGVVVNADGDVLTALHVVDGASAIHLDFADGSQADADVSGSDPALDVAVLHPNQPPDLIVPAILAGLNTVRVGDEAYAVGNPFGLTDSMSAGVISGFNRSVIPEGTEQRLDGLIQFDAAVNPGNSGGPLLNRAGQVIGIVTGLANPSDQRFFVGIGLAVPISTAVGAGGGAPPY
jgi:S1-C subfamily serine protease